jgi:hypothetical protein
VEIQIPTTKPNENVNAILLGIATARRTVVEIEPAWKMPLVIVSVTATATPTAMANANP